jgi:predicted O-methyltransferase YrrM
MYKFGLWQREGEMAAERETGELLHSIVRLIKPQLVIETGTANGSTAYQMGLALKANGFGRLITCDTDQSSVAFSSARCADLPVEVRHCKGIELIEQADEIDFAFVDSWWNAIRLEELRLLADKIKPRGLLALHDVCHNYRPVYDAFQGERNWPSVVFHAPLGLGLWQKPGDWRSDIPIPELKGG